jgi:hypothetical protein
MWFEGQASSRALLLAILVDITANEDPKPGTVQRMLGSM